MKIKISKPTEPQPWLDKSKATFSNAGPSACPVLEIAGKSLEPGQIREHIYQFTSWYFNLGVEGLNLETKVYDELGLDAEKRMSKIPYESWEFFKIDLSTGLSVCDVLAWSYLEDLSNSFGLDVTWDSDEECPILSGIHSAKTLGEIIDAITQLLSSVGVVQSTSQ
jgi:hypothetical protein